MSEATLNRVDAAQPTEAPKLHALVVEFETVDALKAAARRVRTVGFRHWDTHSPFPVHGIDSAMGIRHTRLPWLVFVCGVIGLLGGLSMQWWMNATVPQEWTWIPNFLRGYDYHISGKPLWSFPANIPIIFETTVLLAALAAVVGMFAMNGLPRWHHALFSHPRFHRVTSDRFFLCVEARDPRFDETETTALLEGLNGSAVERVYVQSRTARPAWIAIGTLIVACLALFPPILAYKARVSKSSQPRIHIIQDMDNQERFKAQQPAPVFADGRAMRPAIPGTIARGDEWALGLDPHYFDGRVDGDWATTFPPRVEISEPLLRRGQQRYGIYCAACHGLDGGGNGIVAKRARDKTQISTGWVPPTSLLDNIVRERSLGHIYNTITNGIRTMPPYADQIAVEDRWAIVAYIRALERSQNASIEDVPPDRRSDLR